jgi:uncharacterized protein (DUF305 family)
MKNALLFVAVAAMLAIGGFAIAQTSHGSHTGHGQPAKVPVSASTAAFEAANARMHKAMDIRFTGDADADFMRAMIPHHQGAVDMARIAVLHGKDTEVRKLAEDVIKSQEAEIGQMKAWLAKRGM